MCVRSVTPRGHRVAIFYDPSREVPGEDRYQSLAAGLLHSLCVVPLLSYGATAPLASLAGSVSPTEAAVAAGGKGAVQPEAQSWVARPFGLRQVVGEESDAEDVVLQVVRAWPVGGANASILLNKSVKSQDCEHFRVFLFTLLRFRALERLDFAGVVNGQTRSRLGEGVRVSPSRSQPSPFARPSLDSYHFLCRLAIPWFPRADPFSRLCPSQSRLSPDCSVA